MKVPSGCNRSGVNEPFLEQGAREGTRQDKGLSGCLGTIPLGHATIVCALLIHLNDIILPTP